MHAWEIPSVEGPGTIDARLQADALHETWERAARPWH